MKTNRHNKQQDKERTAKDSAGHGVEAESASQEPVAGSLQALPAHPTNKSLRQSRALQLQRLVGNRRAQLLVRRAPDDDAAGEAQAERIIFRNDTPLYSGPFDDILDGEPLARLSRGTRIRILDESDVTVVQVQVIGGRHDGARGYVSGLDKPYTTIEEFRSLRDLLDFGEPRGGHTVGVLERTEEGRPIMAYGFPGQSSERALVIAGVHGTERQGMEVAQMLIDDLRHSPMPPHFTVIVIPSLFPDSAAHGRRGRREARGARGQVVPSNRNFPAGGQTVEASRDAQGVPRDAQNRAILRENIALMSLMERFSPSRVISIHGTTRAHRAGIFVDPVQGQEARDRGLSIAAAQQVVTNIQDAERRTGTEVTDPIAQRPMGSGRDSLSGDIRARMRRGELPGRTSAGLSAAERARLEETAAVAGNQLFLGPGQESAGWSGSVPGGVSLGGYGPARGMTVFTVEPAINRNTADYAAGARAGDRLTEAQRRIELQSYADAIRTVLLGNSGGPSGP